jgi:serine/threonine protein kinase
MAPEMLTKSGHSFSIDFYCLGALLYELVTGLPPYYSTNTDALYESILKSPVEFPAEPQLSPNIKSLLSQLLIKDPERRLGSTGGVS